MIDYLTVQRFLDFNPMLPPASQGGGGGMSVKTYRVLEALRNIYPKSTGVSRVSQITADTVLVEPLWFTMQEGARLQELIETDAKKVLYCSEFTMLRLNPVTRSSIIEMVDSIIVNCDFQAKLFRAFGIPVSGLLCDPVPDRFHPSPERSTNQVVACGHVSWIKNTEQVIKVFGKLEGKAERVYVGSASLWSTAGPVEDMLQEALYEVCDIVLEDITPYEVMHHFQQARVGFWCAFHDCFATIVHEMLRCGLPVVAGPHGLTNELPVEAIVGPQSQVNSICNILDLSDEMYQKLSDQYAGWARKRVSYDTFVSQFQSILRKIWV